MLNPLLAAAAGGRRPMQVPPPAGRPGGGGILPANRRPAAAVTVARTAGTNPALNSLIRGLPELHVALAAAATTGTRSRSTSGSTGPPFLASSRVTAGATTGNVAAGEPDADANGYAAYTNPMTQRPAINRVHLPFGVSSTTSTGSPLASASAGNRFLRLLPTLPPTEGVSGIARASVSDVA
jgi:hypothetical protein